MSILLVCYSCRKKYKVPQAPQHPVPCKVCGNPLKVVVIENQEATKNETTSPTVSHVGATGGSPLQFAPIPSQMPDPAMMSTVGAIHESPTKPPPTKPPPTKPSPKKTSPTTQSPLRYDNTRATGRSPQQNTNPSGFEKLQSIEELPSQQRDDLQFALRLLETQRISPSIITNAMIDLKAERQKGVSINFGQFLMRQRLIEVTDFVQLVKDMSTMGAEKFDIPEGYNIYLKQDQLLIQDKKMPLRVGDYQILQELGRGGMGIVYRVYHEVLAKEFALKMLLLGERSTEMMVKRFFNEAKAIAKLSHPNIISIHHIGEEDGHPYYTMEFIPGKSLADLIREQKITLHRAVEITQKLAEALSYAHKEKIIHRDIKPQNILMREGDDPVLTDFGLAKDKSTEESSITVSGATLGTPAYMSPEQARGEVRKIGPHSDIYSLGAVLYEMITGFPPFRAKNQAEMLQRVIHDEIASPRVLNQLVPKDVENICLKALEKEPNKRYSSASEFKADLERYLNNEPVKARPITPMNRLFRKAKKHKVASITVVSTFFFLLAFSLFYYRLPGDLKIQTSPKEAQVSIDGVESTEKMIRNLSPGVHSLSIRKEGYQTLETVVIVGRGTVSGYQFNLYSLYGNLIISSNPLGCHVEILSPEGKRIKTIEATPSLAYLHEGKYQIRASKPGYVTSEVSTEVLGGNQNTSIHLDLPSNKAELTILCQPENIGATLEIRPISPGSQETQKLSLPLLQPLPLSEGTYELLMQQRNYVNQKRTLEVRAEQKIQLYAYLEPRILLEYAFPDALATTPSAYDVNEDGYFDFFVPCDDYYVYLLDGKKRQLLWSWKAEGTVNSTPVVYCPKDSKEPVVAFDSLDGYVYLLEAKTGQLKWKKQIDAGEGRLYIESLKSGKEVVFCGTETGKIYCLLLENGKELWRFEGGGAMNLSFILQDISGDSQKELLVVKDKNSPVYQFDPETGKEVNVFRIPGALGNPPTCFYDFDGDQSLDFLVSAEQGAQSILWSPKSKKIIGTLETKGDTKVQILHKGGKPCLVQTTFDPRSFFVYEAVPPFTLLHKEFIGDVMSSGAVFEDVNRDGYLDIIFESEEDKTYVYSGNDFSRLFDFYTSGMNWSKYSLVDVGNGWRFRFKSGETEPILVDINADGSQDIVVASENGTLYGITAKESEILTILPLKEELGSLEYVHLDSGGMFFFNTSYGGSLYVLSGVDGRLLFKLETEKGIKRFQMHCPYQGTPKQFLIQHVDDRLELFSLPDFKSIKPLQERNKEIPCLLDLDQDSVPDWLILSSSKTQLIAKSGKTGETLFNTEFPREMKLQFTKVFQSEQSRELFVNDVKGYVYALSTETGKILRSYSTFESHDELSHLIEDLNQDRFPEVISVKLPTQLQLLDGKTEKVKFSTGKNIRHALAPVSYRGRNGIIAILASINISPYTELYDFDKDQVFDLCFLNERTGIDIINSETGKLVKTIHTPKFVSSNFQLADFDQDGCKDILVGCMDQLYVLSGKTGKPLWQYNFSGRIDFISKVLDMNRDGRLDFWISTRNQRCYQISPRISSYKSF